MNGKLDRRAFLGGTLTLAAGSVVFGGCAAPIVSSKPLFKISLAEWSYHNAMFGKKMDHLDFPAVAQRDHGINAIELVNQFFMDKATDAAYLREFKRRADSEGVAIKLIMCDDEGDLGD